MYKNQQKNKIKNSQFPYKKIIIVVSIFLLLGSIISLYFFSHTKEDSFSVFLQSGDVSFRTKNDLEYSKITNEKIEVKSNTFVKTGSNSKAVVITPNNSVMSLDENTEIQLKSNNHETNIQQFVGNVWYRINKLQEKEAFNIMIASKELPDIIERHWAGDYPGGAEKAIKDGIIVKTNELIDKYAPNYKAVLKADPEKEKQVKTDSGNLFGFSFFRGDDLNTVYYGPVLRNDWLKELNLEVPTTIDEFETVLNAFKKKGIVSPYTQAKALEGDFIAGAFGFNRGWYIDDSKKVAFGPMNAKYKDYLTVLNRWFKDGLFDKNFASNDDNAKKANMLNGKSGATVGLVGGNMGTWINSMKDKDPKYDLVAAPYPTLNKGDKVKFSQKDWKFAGLSAAITTACKNPEIAARLLDYGYSKEGDILFNFGTENVSYTMVNNIPTYTDLILKNSDKLSIAEAMGKYQRACYAAPMVQAKQYYLQFLVLAQQKAAVELWSKANPYPNKYPNATTTPEESAELATIESDINTYVDEITLKVIMGTAPLSEIDKMQTQIKNMKFEKATQLRQAAVDRFNKR